MGNSKTFIIQINGIDKACDDVGKLSDKLETLDKQINNSKLSGLISSTFGSTSGVVKGFGVSVDALTQSIDGLKPLITEMTKLHETNKKAVEEVQKATDTLVKKSEEAAKKEIAIEKKKSEKIKNTVYELTAEKGKIQQDYEKQSLESTQKFREQLKDPAFYQEQLKNLEEFEKQVKELDDKEKKYGAEVKYTEASRLLYLQYYSLQEQLYYDDAEKLKKILSQKGQYFKAYHKNIDDIQALIDGASKIVSGKEEDRKKIITELEDLGDLKKDAAINDLIIQREFIKEEEKLQAERNTRIDELAKTQIERNKRNFLGANSVDKEASKKNYEELKKLRIENIAASENEAVRLAASYDQIAQAFEKGSTGEAKALEEKKNKLHAINEQILKDEAAVFDSKKQYNEAIQKFYNDMGDKLNEYFTKFNNVYSALGGIAKGALDTEISGLEEKQKKQTEAIAATTKAYEEHNNKVKEFEKEAATATGGNAVIVQEQLAREMAARDELQKQKKDHEKENEEIEKQIARKKKQQAKIDKVKAIAEATANGAAAVIKAWGAGPILGPIMAALTAAATTIQLLKIKREWEKLEDGGLLRGKRHSQGGMRIEGSNIEVEGGEYVVNRASTRNNLGLIDYINRQRRQLSPDDISRYYAVSGKSQHVQPATRRMFEEGGQLTNIDTVSSVTAPDNDKILDAISRINFRPVVSVVDIVTAQNSVTNVKDIAGV